MQAWGSKSRGRWPFRHFVLWGELMSLVAPTTASGSVDMNVSTDVVYNSRSKSGDVCGLHCQKSEGLRRPFRSPSRCCAPCVRIIRRAVSRPQIGCFFGPGARLPGGPPGKSASPELDLRSRKEAGADGTVHVRHL